MKSIRILSVVAVAAGLMSASAFAADAGKWDITGAANGNFTLNFGSAVTESIGISGAVGYDLGSGLEFWGMPNFSWTSGGNATVGLQAGFTYNFMSDYRDAVYLTAGAGFNYNGTTTGFAFLGGLGKRFKLSDSVSWNPEITYSTSTTFSTSALGIVPLQFSFFL